MGQDLSASLQPPKSAIKGSALLQDLFGDYGLLRLLPKLPAGAFHYQSQDANCRKNTFLHQKLLLLQISQSKTSY